MDVEVVESGEKPYVLSADNMDTDIQVKVGGGTAPSIRKSTLREELDRVSLAAKSGNGSTDKALLSLRFGGEKEDCELWVNQNPARVAELSIPKEFWATATKDLNGCSGARYTHNNDGTIATLVDTWSCFKIKEAKKTDGKIKYHWYQMVMFIRWNPTERSKFVFCMDFDEDIKNALGRRMSSIDLDNPYAWHATFIEELLSIYDDSVWKLRDLVREAEKARDKTHSSHPDFPQLHEIARHVIHSNETLDVAMDTVDSIVHEHDLFMAGLQGTSSQGATPSSPQTTHSLISKDVKRRLYYLLKEIRAIKARSASLYDRLQNEINLGFNLVSQTDTAAMKIISAVGLVFLPGTFISTLFGMNFFDFAIDDKTGKETFKTSERFWMYWAISLPVTAIVILIWIIWQLWYTILKKTKPYRDSLKGPLQSLRLLKEKNDNSLPR
ncbi:hypothetical protein AJ79_00634 [Helicocarpus griseus UAMH5409]|uniref:Uncharacterized protein n=1 Tax=Helicocarpus griseus UAMH5409 TaxID=1447875 RepID=A0A2B7YAK9_9EURO|nr:hypothetical protein AJ79_00634 [Helicocarpus griseus UAMH5409]